MQRTHISIWSINAARLLQLGAVSLLLLQLLIIRVFDAFLQIKVYILMEPIVGAASDSPDVLWCCSRQLRMLSPVSPREMQQFLANFPNYYQLRSCPCCDKPSNVWLWNTVAPARIHSDVAPVSWPVREWIHWIGGTKEELGRNLRSCNSDRRRHRASFSDPPAVASSVKGRGLAYILAD